MNEHESDSYTFDSNQAPGGVIVYYADGDEEILHVNTYVLDLCECATFEEFVQLTGGTFRGFVYNRDIDLAEDSIWGQVEDRGGFDHVYYQVRTKTGRLVSIDDYGRLVTRPGKRPVFNVFVSELNQASSIDWLTGLAGIERFIQSTKLEVRAATRRGERITLLAFDLMSMKAYNASHGRIAGDELLRAFAESLRTQFGVEASCRHSGDSFYARALGDDVQERVESLFRTFARCGIDGVLPVMAGACVMAGGDELMLVLDRARTACESDDTTWESHLCWYTDEMRSAAMMRAYVLENVGRAIENGWIVPYYQPIVRSSTGRVCGREALARWIDPAYGMLKPKSFVPALEAAGLIKGLDMHMVDCVVNDLASSLMYGNSVIPVSVNLSYRDFDGGNVARELADRADTMGVPHELLRVELAESTAFVDFGLLKEQIKALHEAGFEVWIDGFGTGNASVSVLGGLGLDLIKLDGAFRRDSRDKRSDTVLDGVIRTAKRLGVKTAAEAVETIDQVEALVSIGCNMQQGPFFSAPAHYGADLALPGGGRLEVEPYEERAYWDTVGRVDLSDLGALGEARAMDMASASQLPAGVFELRDGDLHLLRSNDALKDILCSDGLLPKDMAPLTMAKNVVTFDDTFLDALDRCVRTGEQESIAGPLEYGTGLQYIVSHLASCECADAFLVTTIPTMFGAALGVYGDVPVGYAVFRVILSEDGDRAVDAEYVYANRLYAEWLGLGHPHVVGKTLIEVLGASGSYWLPYCYKSAHLGETLHNVMFSTVAQHWLSFDFMPSLVGEHCVFAFNIADAEQREREQILWDRNTSKRIIGIVDEFYDEPDYAVAMNGLLEALSEVIHPDRICVYEKDVTSISSTFEWCAPGVVRQTDTLQETSDMELALWERMLERDGFVVIPNVEVLKGVDDELYTQLNRKKITCMLAMPFYDGDQLLGFFVADNYSIEEGLDTQRLMQTIASFVSTRITNQKRVGELAHRGTHDKLTGLLNRRGIDELLSARMDQFPNDPFVVALLDVDDFKVINDLYGHDVGDEALRTLARDLVDAFPQGAFVSRNGGDEMLVTLFDDDAKRVDELLTNLMARDLVFDLHRRAYSMSLSVGYAWCSGDPDSLAEAYTRADEALYAVKLSGKANYMAWNPSLEQMPQRSLLGFTTREMVNSMPLPIMTHRTSGLADVLFANDCMGHILGFDDVREALLYCDNSVHGFVMSEDWPSLAEKLSRMKEYQDPDDDLCTTFRIVGRDGKPLRVTYRARLVDATGMGEVVYAYIMPAE